MEEDSSDKLIDESVRAQSMQYLARRKTVAYLARRNDMETISAAQNMEILAKHNDTENLARSSNVKKITSPKRTDSRFVMDYLTKRQTMEDSALHLNMNSDVAGMGKVVEPHKIGNIVGRQKLERNTRAYTMESLTKDKLMVRMAKKQTIDLFTKPHSMETLTRHHTHLMETLNRHQTHPMETLTKHQTMGSLVNIGKRMQTVSPIKSMEYLSKQQAMDSIAKPNRIDNVAKDQMMDCIAEEQTLETVSQNQPMRDLVKPYGHTDRHPITKGKYTSNTNLNSLIKLGRQKLNPPSMYYGNYHQRLAMTPIAEDDTIDITRSSSSQSSRPMSELTAHKTMHYLASPNRMDLIVNNKSIEYISKHQSMKHLAEKQTPKGPLHTDQPLGAIVRRTLYHISGKHKMENLSVNKSIDGITKQSEMANIDLGTKDQICKSSYYEQPKPQPIDSLINNYTDVRNVGYWMEHLTNYSDLKYLAGTRKMESDLKDDEEGQEITSAVKYPDLKHIGQEEQIKHVPKQSDMKGLVQNQDIENMSKGHDLKQLVINRKMDNLTKHTELIQLVQRQKMDKFIKQHADLTNLGQPQQIGQLTKQSEIKPVANDYQTEDLVTYQDQEQMVPSPDIEHIDKKLAQNE